MKLGQWLIELQTLLFAGTSNNQCAKIAIGNRGERAARKYLKRKGWRLVATNLHLGHDELDILAVSRDETILAIIEVRSTVDARKKPERTITAKKRATMLRVARKLRGLAKKHDCELRVDIVAVQLADATPTIVHFEGVFPLGEITTIPTLISNFSAIFVTLYALVI